MVGILSYIAPEQIMEAKLVDHRADIYALGVMLYQMLTGKLPFESDNVALAIYSHLNSPLPDPRSIMPQLPVRAARAILRALDKVPETARRRQEHWLTISNSHERANFRLLRRILCEVY